jgi:predicted ester cyclase
MAIQYTAAWCSQKPGLVAVHYAASGSLKINDGSPAVGHAAITASAQAFMSAFPDMVVTMDRLHVTGQSAVYHWTLTGTNTGPGGTGKTVRISGFEEWTLDVDGRIARSVGHFDEVEYARQIREGVESR